MPHHFVLKAVFFHSHFFNLHFKLLLFNCNGTKTLFDHL